MEEVKTLKEKSFEAFDVYKKFEKSLSEEKALKESEKKAHSQLVILENDIDKIKENINQFDKQMNDKDRKLEIINEYLEITQQKGIVKNLNQYLVQKLMNNHNTLMRKTTIRPKVRYSTS